MTGVAQAVIIVLVVAAVALLLGLAVVLAEFDARRINRLNAERAAKDLQRMHGPLQRMHGPKGDPEDEPRGGGRR